VSNLAIKNVILYDPYSSVVGFVEFKTFGTSTEIRAKHNIEGDLILSVNDLAFNMRGPDFITSIRTPIDFDAEVIVVVAKKEGNDITTLASGSINLGKTSALAVTKGGLADILKDTEQPIERTAPQRQTGAAREIDEILRAVCSVDVNGKGICESCPYREHFFGENVKLG
jgi:hypothetical protein